ncbi:hypothetical protein MYX77_01690 [Acidobacteriia bacterium AH_259_A11_L15]|nr:hypothetical protein [Acidobacteriia bacterium AH_259_A11_L15]
MGRAALLGCDSAKPVFRSSNLRTLTASGLVLVAADAFVCDIWNLFGVGKLIYVLKETE